MPGDYEIDEIESMDVGELAAAKARGWKRSAFKEPERGEINLGSALKKPEPDLDEAPDPNSWAKNRDAAEAGEEFTAPSGQKCLLRRLEPEELVRLGILDRITRLEGLAQTLVDKSEGQPPTAADLPNREDMELLLETVDLLMPHAVAVPKVYANDDEEAPPGAIRVRHIDLMDRVAIMERSIRKLKMMDRFRNAG